jgi:uncharacterized cupin superfamily protein
VNASKRQRTRSSTPEPEELRYLAVSTQSFSEASEYPDSGKFAVSAERGTLPDGKPHRLVYVGRESQSLEYWDEE